jgi:hypothetical protein
MCRVPQAGVAGPQLHTHAQMCGKPGGKRPPGCLRAGMVGVVGGGGGGRGEGRRNEVRKTRCESGWQGEQALGSRMPGEGDVD